MKLVVVLMTAFLAAVMVNSQTALEKFAAGNLEVTANVYRNIQLTLPDENLIYSPLFIQITLALLRAGAKGATATAITKALRLPDPQTTEEAFGQLFPALEQSSESLEISKANKIYLGKNIALIKPFKDLATSLYGSDIAHVDFSKAEEAALIINQWVETQTNNKIQSIINSDGLHSATRMILVNALHFLGKWSSPFDLKRTSTADFHTSKCSSKLIQMMLQEGNFRYYECSKTRAKYIELPYQDPRFTMTIGLPNEIEDLDRLEHNISQVLSPKDFQSRSVILKVPRFTTETTLKLIPILNMMGRIGQKELISDANDFSGISHERLLISDIIQKVVINVTESGTEVATGTAVTGETSSLLQSAGQVIFNVNRPFCYFIKYKSIVLFFGKKIN